MERPKKLLEEYKNLLLNKYSKYDKKQLINLKKEVEEEAEQLELTNKEFMAGLLKQTVRFKKDQP